MKKRLRSPDEPVPSSAPHVSDIEETRRARPTATGSPSSGVAAVVSIETGNRSDADRSPLPRVRDRQHSVTPLFSRVPPCLLSTCKATEAASGRTRLAHHPRCQILPVTMGPVEFDTTTQSTSAALNSLDSDTA